MWGVQVHGRSAIEALSSVPPIVNINPVSAHSISVSVIVGRVGLGSREEGVDRGIVIEIVSLGQRSESLHSLEAERLLI